ncbi:hypothetical protein [Actinomadura citrea]|uniref:Uncharacterized protein n=1 Tax=Actinomadura citrea TaxID=46158 RepID=A0A7Y9GM93_9ACTN|nr:hypothetical protein [Actinomadura citrea]NYE17960.1 hypothetical protein [Actinomadura citrea]GGT62691.1 hypothetical protein GCM10010177_19650 [Actinomadura citrea]
MTDETKAHPTARNDEDTTRLATNLYEHVRQLNHATVGPPSLTLPATAYTILGNLSAATYGLDQVLHQISRFLLRELQADRLGHDQAEDLAEVLSRHGQALAEARQHARALCAALSNAQSAINTIHSRATRVREALPTIEVKAHVDDAGVAAAANDFPRPITDPTLLAPPPIGEQNHSIRSRRASTLEA